MVDYLGYCYGVNYICFMNKNALYLIGAGIVGLLAFNFIKKGVALSRLNFAIKGFDFNIKKKAGFVDLRIINPGSEAVTINSIVCDVLVQEEAVGTIKYLKDQLINGRSEVVIKIPIQVNVIAVTTLAVKLATSKQEKIDFQIKGNASADNVLFPVNVTYSYDLKTLVK